MVGVEHDGLGLLANRRRQRQRRADRDAATAPSRCRVRLPPAGRVGSRVSRPPGSCPSAPRWRRVPSPGSSRWCLGSGHSSRRDAFSSSARCAGSAAALPKSPRLAPGQRCDTLRVRIRSTDLEREEPAHAVADQRRRETDRRETSSRSARCARTASADVDVVERVREREVGLRCPSCPGSGRGARPSRRDAAPARDRRSVRRRDSRAAARRPGCGPAPDAT